LSIGIGLKEAGGMEESICGLYSLDLKIDERFFKITTESIFI